MFAKKQIIHAKDGSPYMIRWAFNTPFGGVKLHHILRSDEDRDLHDHPWSFLSIILWGGYYEVRPCDCAHGCAHLPIKERAPILAWHSPFSVLWRPAPSPHRLVLPEHQTAWSLVFTSPKSREWGFHTVCGFIPWFRYEEAKEEGC